MRSNAESVHLLSQQRQSWPGFIDLENSLFRAGVERQAFGQPEADPGRIIECDRSGKEMLVSNLSQDLAQHIAAQWVDRRLSDGRWPQFDFSFDQAVGLRSGGNHREARFTMGPQVKQSRGRHVPVRDPCEATSTLGHCRGADLQTFPYQAYPERLAVAQAAFGHLEVTLLENLERKYAVREQYRLQGKQEHAVGHGCAQASSRCRTSIRAMAANSRASFSTMYTER